jgi:TPR repeat protein
LGHCYTTGEGVPKDDKEAVKWYQEAAWQGYAEAQYSLGWCYKRGEGVLQNDKDGNKWLDKAREQKYADAVSQVSNDDEETEVGAGKKGYTDKLEQEKSKLYEKTDKQLAKIAQSYAILPKGMAAMAILKERGYSSQDIARM